MRGPGPSPRRLGLGPGRRALWPAGVAGFAVAGLRAPGLKGLDRPTVVSRWVGLALCTGQWTAGDGGGGSRGSGHGPVMHCTLDRLGRFRKPELVLLSVPFERFGLSFALYSPRQIELSTGFTS